ncbi:MAG: 50S ribosomal protein L23 [Patescibacteria group bacterium]|nr:50S ribosomal protein L23 [Patescibacteria group bacterium]
MSKTTILRPRLNEKTYALSNDRVYVFEVEQGVNKHTIARAVESQFDVKVSEVNTLNQKGKAKRIISINGKRMKNAEGRRNDFRKAYVTLAEGFSLPFFNAVEEADEKEQAIQEKVEKAALKQADKAAGEAAKNDKAAKSSRLSLGRKKKDEEK